MIDLKLYLFKNYYQLKLEDVQQLQKKRIIIVKKLKILYLNFYGIKLQNVNQKKCQSKIYDISGTNMNFDETNILLHTALGISLGMKIN